MVARREGLGIRETARIVGRSPSAVKRELDRNSCCKGRPNEHYRASTAQARCDERKAARRRRRKLDDPGLASLVQGKILDDRWSPEQVAGRLELEKGRKAVSGSTVRRAIGKRDLDTPELRKTARRLAGRLRHKGKRRHRKGTEERRGRLPVQHELSERPEAANRRGRAGDWEADTVVGAGAGACPVTLVDRDDGFLAGGRAASHTKAAVADVEIGALSKQPARTITPDRGKEFADWPRVYEETGAEFCFCAAHHPWEKGLNENTNGLIREYFPKGTDFGAVTDEEVARAYDAINRRPRKRLGWRTPQEAHCSEVLRLL